MWLSAKDRSPLWALVLLAIPTRATFWLNQLDEYDSLPVCAEKPLSYIVRDMASGCGDGSKRTSYNCFCSTSSSEFVDIIATAVEDECKHKGTEVTSATSIFSAYCQLGKKSVATASKTKGDDTKTTSEDPTSKPTEGASIAPSSTGGETAKTTDTSTEAASSTPAVTSTTTSSSIVSTTAETLSTTTSSAVPSSNSAQLSTGSKVAIGVCVPISIIALASFIFLYYRRLRENRRRHTMGNVQLETAGGLPNHWPLSSPSERRLDSSGTDYFVSNSASMGSQHKQWPSQSERSMSHRGINSYAMSPGSIGQPNGSSEHVGAVNPFISAPAPAAVFEKAELDGTPTPQYELPTKSPPLKKYELE